MSDSIPSGTISQTSLNTSSTSQPTTVYEHHHLSSAARLIRSDSSKHARGRSLGLIDAARVRLAKDFPSLLRSSSRSSRQASLRTEALPPGSSRSSSSEDARPHQQAFAPSEFAQMDSSTAHDDRHSRSIGSRIVNFLSRSRSRSRSRKRRSLSLDALPVGQVPAMPTPTGTIGRHTRHSSMQDENHAPSTSLSKPASRIRSRPLSSTTTATDTTVKPTQKKLPDIPQQQSNTRPTDHEVHIQANIVPLDSSLPSRKEKKMNIFAMGMPSRKSSVDSKKSTRSRPSSPSPGDSAIALPAPAERPNWMGRLRSGSGSKTTTPQNGSQRSGTTTYSQANSAAPSDFLSTVQPPQSHPAVPRPDMGRIGIDGQPDSGDFGGRCSPLCWPHSRSTPPVIREKSGDRARTRGSKERASSATRDGTYERDRDKVTVHRVGSPILREREGESRSALGAAPMERVASAGRASRRSSGQGSAFPNPSAVNIGKMKQNKHGSFDFERPVSFRPDAVNMRSALRDMGIGPDSKVPISQQMQRSVSLKATPRVTISATNGHPRAHILKSKIANTGDRTTKPQLDSLQIEPSRHKADLTTPVSSSLPHSHSATRVEDDPTSPVSSTSGHSSSWGKSAGKRALRSAHGAFRFEPAVPAIPGSPAHEEQKSAARGSPGYSGSPTRHKPDRVGAKGRSLDLGIGLSWAPTRVKEEAVLAYGAGRPGGGANASTSRARARWRGGWVDEEGRLNATPGGSDVAEAFKEALGDAAYATFKIYVHRFDANAIPLDGPYGLISHVKRLLDEANSLGEREKRALIDRFVQLVHENQ